MRTIKGFPWPCSGVRLVFVKLESGEEESGTSFCNQAEATMVQIVVVSVLRADDKCCRNPANIRILTPYDAQRSLLRKAAPAQVSVGSIDAFQGQEGFHDYLNNTS